MNFTIRLMPLFTLSTDFIVLNKLEASLAVEGVHSNVSSCIDTSNDSGTINDGRSIGQPLPHTDVRHLVRCSRCNTRRAVHTPSRSKSPGPAVAVKTHSFRFKNKTEEFVPLLDRAPDQAARSLSKLK